MTPVSEEEMINRLVAEVKRRYPNSKLKPDYRGKNMLPAQWKQLGGIRYWQRSGDLNPVLAVWDKYENKFYIDEKGLDMDAVATMGGLIR